MKIVLELSEFDNKYELTDAVEFVKSMQAQVEKKQYQGFPGMIMERGDGSIWVTKVELID